MSHGKPLYGWDVYKPRLPKQLLDSNLTMPALGGVLASSLVHQPVYVSMTTIAARIGNLHQTISEVLMGPVIPDRIYVFVSRDPYLIDEGVESSGFRQIPPEMNVLAAFYPVTIVFVENIGPHRKLLPLLDNKWNEDCVIITLDDEYKFWIGNYVQQLINYYTASGRESVVSLKARRIGFCNAQPYSPIPYTQWGEAAFGMHEFFLMPTGTGGVLYRPKFFHPVVFDRLLMNLTRTTDDIAFRLATMVKGVFTVTGCRVTRSHRDKSSSNSTNRMHMGSILYDTKCARSSNDTEIALSRYLPPRTKLSPRNSFNATDVLLVLQKQFRNQQVTTSVTTTTTTTVTTTRKPSIRGGSSSKSSKNMEKAMIDIDIGFKEVAEEVGQLTDQTQPKLQRKPSLRGSERNELKEPQKQQVQQQQEQQSQKHHGRRLLKELSLYSNFNMKEGNDKSFSKSVQYLRDLRLMDLSSYAKRYLSAERGQECFGNNSSQLTNFPGGQMSCMVQTCRSGRRRKTKALSK